MKAVDNSTDKLLAVDRPEIIDGYFHVYSRRWQHRLYVTRSMPEYITLHDQVLDERLRLFRQHRAIVAEGSHEHF